MSFREKVYVKGFRSIQLQTLKKIIMMCECSRSQRVGWKVDKVT